MKQAPSLLPNDEKSHHIPVTPAPRHGFRTSADGRVDGGGGRHERTCASHARAPKRAGRLSGVVSGTLRREEARRRSRYASLSGHFLVYRHPPKRHCYPEILRSSAAKTLLGTRGIYYPTKGTTRPTDGSLLPLRRTS